MSKYKLQSKYPAAYRDLENALDNYAENNELENMSYKALAQHVIDFCNKTFNHINNHQERIIHFLQGLGLDIEYTNHAILEIAYKDGRAHPYDSDSVKDKVLERYWRFMAMRLINISDLKEL